jgi:hypothetical protein
VTAPPLSQRPGVVAALCALLAVPTSLRAWQLAHRGAPEWAYGLDDAYIHLAMARTWAEAGVWGLHPDQPASASSSPLWTLAIGVLYRWVPEPDALPWLFCSVSLAALLGALAQGAEGGPATRAAVATTVAFLSGAFGLVVLGMEQSAQLVALACFLPLAERSLSEDRHHGWAAAALGATVALRPETLAAVPGLVALAAIKGLRRPALALGAGGLSGMVVYVTVSMALSGALIPQSVQAKSASFGRTDLLVAFWERFSEQPPFIVFSLFALLVWCAATLAQTPGPRRDARWILLGALSLALVVQLVVGRVGQNLSRYEAWIALWGAWLGLTTSLDAANPRGPLWLAATGIGLFGSVLRAGLMTGFALQGAATTDIVRQHLPLARFVREVHPDEVVLNDVGAVAYYSRVRVFDVIGLADAEVFQLKRQDRFDLATLGALPRKRGAAFAAMYPEWLGGETPPGWTEVGRWETPGNFVAGGPAVAFFAILEAPEVLEAQLEAFSPAAGVTWRRATSRPPRPPPAQP